MTENTAALTEAIRATMTAPDTDLAEMERIAAQVREQLAAARKIARAREREATAEERKAQRETEAAARRERAAARTPEGYELNTDYSTEAALIFRPKPMPWIVLCPHDKAQHTDTLANARELARPEIRGKICAKCKADAAKADAAKTAS